MSRPKGSSDVVSLDRALRRKVVFSSESLTDHLTQNAVRVRPLERVGVLTGDLPSAAQRRVLEIVRTYPANHTEAAARKALTRVERAGIVLTGDLPGVPHYYRAGLTSTASGVTSNAISDATCCSRRRESRIRLSDQAVPVDDGRLSERGGDTS